MKMLFRDRLAIVLVVTLLICSLAAWGATQYFSGMRIGAGGLLVRAGNFTVQDTNLATKFSVAHATGNTAVAGTLAVTGASTIPIQTVVTEAGATRTCTTADCGKIIQLTRAGAVDVTLPANGTTAGSQIDFIIATENNSTVTLSPATADTLLTANSADSDAVTFGTGHRLGAYVRMIAVTQGATTYWQAVNLGQTTMGVTDTD